MSKEKEVKQPQRSYSKEAFVESATDGKESLILQVILEDGKSYSKEKVTEMVTAWKSKKVNAKVEKEKKEVKA
ncbi:hypothetical protein H7992_07170 [Sporosarcina sp. resist]|uniref:hypothetical protein n=1 Tax=Sporosarcina sp. resist TaxID=2762563 RepID=UPI00164E76F2|nr:hypothetical protein [Sporosarcina sp. resist]QNK89438.1 hypothetical protein H7992_07170 [Sporosarcina sp. resist]